eukprot:GHVU01125559.1.p2 GENE.GHVU01125559.1~~GHVU01125559.1.p2  ORF type:complete len:581 (-),score=58.73 GHVU01125559.1:126-1868(-)
MVALFLTGVVTLLPLNRAAVIPFEVHTPFYPPASLFLANTEATNNSLNPLPTPPLAQASHHPGHPGGLQLPRPDPLSNHFPVHQEEHPMMQTASPSVMHPHRSSHPSQQLSPLPSPSIASTSSGFHLNQDYLHHLSTDSLRDQGQHPPPITNPPLGSDLGNLDWSLEDQGFSFHQYPQAGQAHQEDRWDTVASPLHQPEIRSTTPHFPSIPHQTTHHQQQFNNHLNSQDLPAESGSNAHELQMGAGELDQMMTTDHHLGGSQSWISARTASTTPQPFFSHVPQQIPSQFSNLPQSQLHQLRQLQQQQAIHQGPALPPLTLPPTPTQSQSTQMDQERMQYLLQHIAIHSPNNINTPPAVSLHHLGSSSSRVGTPITPSPSSTSYFPLMTSSSPPPQMAFSHGTSNDGSSTPPVAPVSHHRQLPSLTFSESENSNGHSHLSSLAAGPLTSTGFPMHLHHQPQLSSPLTGDGHQSFQQQQAMASMGMQMHYTEPTHLARFPPAPFLGHNLQQFNLRLPPRFSQQGGNGGLRRPPPPKMQRSTSAMGNLHTGMGMGEEGQGRGMGMGMMVEFPGLQPQGIPLPE